MRSIALDVHRDFCEVAIKDGGELRSAGGSRRGGRARAVRAEPGQGRPGGARGDRAGERHRASSSPTWACRDRQHPPGAGDRRGQGEVRQGGRGNALRVARRRLSARRFEPRRANPGVTRACSGGARLVRSRTRAKNAVHAALARDLKGRPPMSDVFGRGDAWLGRLELPARRAPDRRRRLRQVDFLSREIAALERSSPGGALVGAGQAAHDRPRGGPRLGSDVRGGSRRHRPLRDAQEAGLLCRARPQGAPVRRGQARHGRISKRARPRRATCSARPPGSRSGRRAPCAPSTSACERGAVRRSRSWRRGESSACSSGICSAAQRTTPSNGHR